MITWLLNTFKDYFAEEEVDKLHLWDLPAHLTEDIIRKMDLASRLSFRNTSVLFHNFTDWQRLHINLFHIKFDCDYIDIAIDDDFRVHYQDIGGGIVVKYQDTMKLLSGENLVDVYHHTLKGIFGARMVFVENLKLEGTHKKREPLDSGKVAAIVRHVFHGFKDLKTKLNVESLFLRCGGCSVDWLFEIMPTNCIKSLQLDHTTSGREPYNNTIFNTEQWKNARRVTWNHQFEAKYMIHMAHFVVAKLKMRDTMTVEQFMQFKEALLCNPDLDQMHIECTPAFRFDHCAEINRQIGSYNPWRARRLDWATIRYPNDPKKKLKCCVTRKFIKIRGPCFVKEEVEDVPAPVEVEHDSDDDRDDFQEEQWEDEEEIVDFVPDLAI